MSDVVPIKCAQLSGQAETPQRHVLAETSNPKLKPHVPQIETIISLEIGRTGKQKPRTKDMASVWDITRGKGIWGILDKAFAKVVSSGWVLCGWTFPS